MARLLATLMSPATPLAIRSAGIWLTPELIISSGDLLVLSSLKIRIFPPLTLRRPVRISTSCFWPFPATPATPRISPERIRKEIPLSAGRPLSSFALTSVSSRATSPRVRSFFSSRKSTSRPTIKRASSWGLVRLVCFTVTRRPLCRTLTQSENAMTSSILWVMKMADLPSRVICSRIPFSSFDSCGVKTAVGSSRIRISAPR